MDFKSTPHGIVAHTALAEGMNLGGGMINALMEYCLEIIFDFIDKLFEALQVRVEQELANPEEELLIIARIEADLELLRESLDRKQALEKQESANGVTTQTIEQQKKAYARFAAQHQSKTGRELRKDDPEFGL